MFGLSQRIFVSLILLLAFATEPALAIFRPDTMPRNESIEKDITDGEAAEKSSQFDVAEGHYKAAEIKLTETIGANDNQLADVYTLLARLLRRLKKFPDAIDYAQKLVDLETRMYGGGHVYVAESIKQLADAQVDAEQFADARTNYWKAALSPAHGSAESIPLMTSGVPSQRIKRADLVVACYDGIARSYELENDPKNVLATYKRALAYYSKWPARSKFKTQMESTLYTRYRNYLNKLTEQAAQSDADSQLEAVRRKEYLNQEYPAGILPTF
jgi:hypothetical protein